MRMQLKNLLSAEPFIPFTVIMNDGTHYTIKQRDMAMLTKLFLYASINGGETAEHLYLAHVRSIEQQERAA